MRSLDAKSSILELENYVLIFQTSLIDKVRFKLESVFLMR